MAQHTINIPILESTWLDLINQNANNGSSTILKMEQVTHDGVGGYTSGAETLMRFNYPYNDKKVISASLMVYIVSASYLAGSYSSDTVIGKTSNNWTENTTFSNWDKQQVDTMFARIDIVGKSGFTKVAEIKTLIVNGINNLYMYASDAIAQVQSTRGTNKPYISLVYEDMPPDAAVLVSPLGGYWENSAPIRLDWNYVGLGTQSKFDLQYSTNGGTSFTTITQTTANNFLILPINTLPAGTVMWKVTTYNQYNEASPVSTVGTFNVVGAGSPPTITGVTTNSGRPTVTWTATGQQIYQMQILKDNVVVYDSGSIANQSIKSHKCTKFLSDGTYTAMCRTKNEYNLYSGWANYNFTINSTKPTKPSIVATRGINCIIVSTDNVIGIKYYIYRAEINDYVCLGQVQSTLFYDYSAKNNCVYKYFVRAINANEAFIDSDIIYQSASFNFDTLASINDLSNVLILKSNLDNKPPKKSTISRLGETLYFSGREYPVREYSGFSNENVSLQFYLSESELQKIINIINLKQPVLYRKNRGQNIYGNISDLNIDDEDEGYTVNFTITRTDYNEEKEV